MATYTEGSIVYEVSIDTKNMIQNSGKVREELNKLNANGKTASKGLDQVEQSADKASQSMFKLSSVAKAVSAALVSSQVISYAQSWNELEDRIANTGATAYQTKEILDQLLETSNRNGRTIEESSELYIRLSNSMKEMGYSTSGTLNYIDTLSNLLTINKTSTQAAESAINALTRAQMKGKLSGIEAESVFNAMPSVLQTLAKEFSKTGKAVTELDVRTMAKNGELSMRKFSSAIISAQEDTAALADNMRNNVNDGITRITNNLKKYFGELNNATGGTRLIVDALILMSQHVNILATGVGVLGAIYAGKYVTSLAAATKQSVSKTLADINQAKSEKAAAAAALEQAKAETTNALAAQKSLAAQLALAKTEQTRTALRQQLKANTVTLTAAVDAEAAAQARLAAAAKTSSFAMNGLKSAMNLLGGPAGILLIAAGAMYAWSQSNEEAKKRALEASDNIKQLAESFETLTEKQKAAARAKIDVDIIAQQKAVKSLSKEVENATNKYNDLLRGIGSGQFTVITDKKKKESLANVTDLQAKLEEANKGYNDLLAAREKMDAGTFGESKVGDNTKTENDLYTEQVNILTGLLTKKKELTELEKINAEITNGALKDLEPAQQAELQRLAQQIDLMRERELIEKARAERAKEAKAFSDQQIYGNKSELEKIDADEAANIERLNTKYKGELTEQQYQDTLTAIVEKAAKRRKAIEDDELQARINNMTTMLSATSSLFDGIAGILKNSAGKQSEAYKTMFAISKGFQIASSLLALYGAAVKAMDDPTAITPAQKIANYAAVMAAGGSVVSSISSLNYDGARYNGGSVKAGSMYRVGENNKPEILQSGGKQYMIAGENGRVFSNSDVTGGQSKNIVVNISNNAGAEVTAEYDNSEQIIKIAVNKANATVANSIRNKSGDVWQALSSTTNTRSRL